ncbi:hypothetical protein ACVWYH_007289 [Bradyrhizobium sp. GM24.11]
MVAKRPIDNEGAKDAFVTRDIARAWVKVRQGPGTRSGAQEVRNEGEGHLMFERKQFSRAAALAAIAGLAAVAPAKAEDTVKVGLILPMTGGQASTGKQIENAIKLYMQQKGDTVAGKKIEIILKDDAAIPDKTKTAAQELIVNDKVNFIGGFGVTPAALAAAPLATQAKIPEVVMAGRHFDHHRAFALYRAHQLHARAVLDHHRRLGGEERHQEGGDADVGLCAGQ